MEFGIYFVANSFFRRLSNFKYLATNPKRFKFLNIVKIDVTGIIESREKK